MKEFSSYNKQGWVERVGCKVIKSGERFLLYEKSKKNYSNIRKYAL
jgi:hypothetical protein